MNEPRRLLDEERGFRQELLLAARDLPPVPSDAVARTLTAVGVGTAVGAAAGMAQASALGAKLSTSILSKWFALGAVVGVAAAGTVHEVRVVVREPSVESSRPTQPAPSVVRPRRAAAVNVAPVESSRESAAEAVPSHPVVLRRLGDEAELIDSATRAVERGEAGRALDFLDRHQREFPAGQLAKEAKLVRLRVHALRGERAEAEKLGAELLTIAPEGRFAERVRRILGSVEEKRPGQ